MHSYLLEPLCASPQTSMSVRFTMEDVIICVITFLVDTTVHVWRGLLQIRIVKISVLVSSTENVIAYNERI